MVIYINICSTITLTTGVTDLAMVDIIIDEDIADGATSRVRLHYYKVLGEDSEA